VNSHDNGEGRRVTAAVLTAGDVINRPRCLIGHAIFIPAHSEPVTSTGLLSAISGPARITGTSRAAIRRPQFASVMFPSLLKFSPKCKYP